MPDLDSFMLQLSSADPVPGGGSVAALECAMGAALLVMVANLTLGRKKYAAVETRVREIATRATELRERASQLAQEDAEAYGAVAHVLSMPKETDEEKALRRAHMQAALKRAVDPPFQTMTTASEVIDLALELMTIGNRSAISDVGTAAGSARAAFEAALLNVEINLASIHDVEWVRDLRSRLERVPAVSSRSDDVSGYVLTAIRS